MKPAAFLICCIWHGIDSQRNTHTFTMEIERKSENTLEMQRNK